MPSPLDVVVADGVIVRDPSTNRVLLQLRSDDATWGLPGGRIEPGETRKYDPTNAADLHTAAAILSRSAQQQRPGGQISRRVKESPLGTARLFMAAKADDKPQIRATVLVTQIVAT